MFGLLSQKPSNNVARIEGIEFDTADIRPLSPNAFNGGGSNFIPVTTNSQITTPSQNFDISVLAGLRDSDKYLGRNRVSDIKETYRTYLTGIPEGRGGQYAVDAARRYGTSIVEAARGYLVNAGLPTLADILPVTNTNVTTNNPLPDLEEKEFFSLPDRPNNTVTQKNPFEVLADILPTLFGNAVYNPPLQSQAYGYTPTTTETPLTQSGGTGIGMIVILGAVGIIGYFLYKRFAK
jgi:hypothetical protein